MHSYSQVKNYSVADTFSEAGIDSTEFRKGHGEVATTCPQCSASRKPEHQKLKCLNVNLTQGKWKCHHCDYAGRLANEADEIAEKRRSEQATKVYKLPELGNSTQLSDGLVRWFADERGLTQDTLRHFGLREEKGWMRFPYFVGEQCVNIKYRKVGEKKFQLGKEAKLVLFNLNAIQSCREAIIVEGEIDALTWHQAGFPNVVSVPNGTSLSAKEKQEFERTGQFNDAHPLNLEYLDNCWDDIQHIETWYIAGDTDAAGQKLRRELIRRFGAEKCKLVSYRGYKDANELATRASILDLQGCLLEATGVPLDGIHTVDTEMDDILHLMRNGLPMGAPIGIEEFNGYFSLLPAQLTIWTGVPGDGKTTVAYFLMMLTSLLYGWKWAVYSPENYPVAELFIYLAQLLVGREARGYGGTPEGEKEFLSALHDHIRDHFFVINSNRIHTHEGLRTTFQALVARYGIVGYCVDPFNDVDAPNVKDPSTFVTKELSEYRRLNRECGTTGWILAHPRTLRKVEGTNMYPITQASDIYGGGAWWARADNIICVHRERRDSTDFTTHLHVHKFKKHRQGGGQTDPADPISLTYELGSGRFHGTFSHSTIAQFEDSVQRRVTVSEQRALDGRHLALPLEPKAGTVNTSLGSDFDDYPDLPTQPLAYDRADDGYQDDDEPPF